MTKEELYNRLRTVAVDSMPSSIQHTLDEFFLQNVVIPKGKNRHPYADVLHEWVEGSKMQKRYMVKDDTIQNQVRTKWIDFSLSANDEYRIKPQEPVYEWQWVIVGTEYSILENMTEKEALNLATQIVCTLSKVEETKRVRQ